MKTLSSSRMLWTLVFALLFSCVAEAQILKRQGKEYYKHRAKLFALSAERKMSDEQASELLSLLRSDLQTRSIGAFPSDWDNIATVYSGTNLPAILTTVFRAHVGSMEWQVRDAHKSGGAYFSRFLGDNEKGWNLFPTLKCEGLFGWIIELRIGGDWKQEDAKRFIKERGGSLTPSADQRPILEELKAKLNEADFKAVKPEIDNILIEAVERLEKAMYEEPSGKAYSGENDTTPETGLTRGKVLERVVQDFVLVLDPGSAEKLSAIISKRNLKIEAPKSEK